MLTVRLKGIGSRAELRNYISSSGCYAREENERIYDKWFADAPRHLFKAVNEKSDGVVFVLWGGYAQKKEKLDWRHSIVDLMKVFDLVSSLSRASSWLRNSTTPGTPTIRQP